MYRWNRMVLALTMAVSLLISACSASAPTTSGTEMPATAENGVTASAGSPAENETSILFYSPQRVYAASKNVYTGTLLSKELHQPGIGAFNIPPLYKVTVKVNEVMKGNFQPGTVIEDVLISYFRDLGCDYLFVTGEDTAYGYSSITYERAEKVYSGKLLAMEPYSPQTDTSPAMYKVTVETKEVMKGNFKAGEVVEDITSGQYEVGENYIFMTGENDPSLGQKRLQAFHITNNHIGNVYGMVKLLDDDRVEYSPSFHLDGYSDNYHGWQGGKRPPETYTELVRRMKQGVDNKPFIPVASPYACPCEYPDEIILDALDALKDSYRDPKPIKERFYCKAHEVDNLLRFEDKQK